jgi:hypothetical protein
VRVIGVKRRVLFLCGLNFLIISSSLEKIELKHLLSIPFSIFVLFALLFGIFLLFFIVFLFLLLMLVLAS